MTCIGKNSKKDSNVTHPLDRVNMRYFNRDMAKARMESAELFANLVCRAGSGLQSMAAGFGHGCSALAHRIRAAFGKLAHH